MAKKKVVEEELDDEPIDDSEHSIPEIVVGSEIKIDTSRDGFFQELDKMKADPYNYVIRFYEEMYPHMGGVVMSVISLLPSSLVLPEFIDSVGKRTTSRISYLLLAPPGCLDGDSYITLRDGTFKKIKNFGKNHLDQIEQSIMRKAKNQCSCDMAKVFHKYENEPCFEIRLSSGRKLILSELHPLMTDKGWVRAVDLKEGDNIKVCSVIKCSKKDYESLSYSKFKNNSKKINLPKCNEEVGLLFGYALGDGYLHGKYKTTFCINSEETDIIGKLANYTVKNFGLTPKLRIRDLSKYTAYIGDRKINRTKLMNYLEIDSVKITEIFKFVKEKKVPEVIMASKKSVVSGFLKGLFEADGCCRFNVSRRRYSIHLKSVNHSILEDVQLLLLKFGIKANIEYDCVSINKIQDVYKFYKEIGFLSEKKIEKLKKIVSALDNRNEKRKKFYSRRYYEKIKEIKIVENRTVYDIEVPKSHQYIANGIISHNTAKTALSTHFSKFAKNSFPFEYITDSSLSSVLDSKKEVTLVTSDIARIFRDPILAKQIENIIGDEGKLSRFTQKVKVKEEKLIDAVGYFAGTPGNINSVISDGIIFRVHPCVIFHNEKQHEEILNEVNQRIGNFKEGTINREDVIIYYYQQLYKIQEGKGEIKEINGYDIPQYFRDEIKEKLIPLFRVPFKTTNFEFVRELNQCYKYMVAHAFLNIYNRQLNGNKIILENEDLRVAMALSEKEIKTKTTILKCINLVSEHRIKTLLDLNYTAKYLKNTNNPLTEMEYRILQTIIRSR